MDRIKTSRACPFRRRHQPCHRVPTSRVAYPSVYRRTPAPLLPSPPQTDPPLPSTPLPAHLPESTFAHLLCSIAALSTATAMQPSEEIAGGEGQPGKYDAPRAPPTTRSPFQWQSARTCPRELATGWCDATICPLKDSSALFVEGDRRSKPSYHPGFLA